MFVNQHINQHTFHSLLSLFYQLEHFREILQSQPHHKFINHDDAYPTMDTKLIFFFQAEMGEKKDNINLLIKLHYIVVKLNPSVASKRENEVWEKQHRNMVP